MVQVLPNKTSLKNLKGIKLGIVADPALLSQNLRDVANQLVRKVVQARAYADRIGSNLFFVIQKQESLPLTRYIDAMGGIVVTSEPNEFSQFNVPVEELTDVDAFIVFLSESSDYSFDPPLDSEAEVTEVHIKPGVVLPAGIKTRPFTEKIPKAKQLKDPYAKFHIPQDMFVVKMPDMYRENKLQDKPDFPENYKLGDN